MLGPPDRLGRRRARRARSPRRPRRPRGARPAAPPAARAPRGQARVGWISRGRAQLHLPAADGAAGRGLRRGHLLRAVLARAAAAGGRCTSATTSPAAPAAPTSCAPSSSGAARRPRAEARGATASAIWLRSPCLGLCEQAPAALVTVAGEQPRERRSAAPADGGRHRDARPGRRLRRARRRRPRLPQAGDPALRLLRRVGVVDPASLDDYRAARRLRGAAPRARPGAGRG